MLKMIIMVGSALHQKPNFQTKQEFHYLHYENQAEIDADNYAHKQLLWN